MSRIGKAPIPVPGGVTVSINGSDIAVKGPKGELSRTLPEQVTVRQDGDTIVVERADDERESRSLHGLVRSLVQNMVTGVTDGFHKDLDIVGVGYRAELKGRQITFALGYSHPIVFDIPAGIEVTVDKLTHLTVTGVDRQMVGQVAADIHRMRKPDPYKQKGVRYTGEVLKKKVGKTGA